MESYLLTSSCIDAKNEMMMDFFLLLPAFPIAPTPTDTVLPSSDWLIQRERERDEGLEAI